MDIQNSPILPPLMQTAAKNQLPASVPPSAVLASVVSTSSQESSQITANQGSSQAQLDFVGDPLTEAYQKLNPQQKKAYDQLLNLSGKTPAWLAQPGVSSNPFAMASVPVFSAQEQKMLKDLLANGTLTQTSANGTSIVEYLHNLATDDRNDKVSGPQLVKDCLRMLQPEDMAAVMKKADQMSYKEVAGTKKQGGIPFPGGLGEITQCPVHYTCGAASIQVFMRLNQPAEVVRLVHDLVRQGSAQMNGDSLKPAPGSLDFHAGDTIYKGALKLKSEGKEDRSDLDIILQSAVMEKTALGNLSDYDVDTDSGGLLNVVAGNSGSHPLYMKRTLEQLTGQSFNYEHNLNLYNSGGIGRLLGNLSARTDQSQMVADLKKHVQAGKAVIIAYQTNPSDQTALHYVTVTNYDPDSDRFYYADTGELKAERSKMYTKTTADMNEVLRAIIYPE
jgi:hypothetical protein